MTQTFKLEQGSIGIFDSGYGGLTILENIRKKLPQYSYIYLGDNARTPYGTRSFEVVYEFTLQAVKKLFELGCPLVILACNTASAKALRNIQQHDLPLIAPERRVLGVIRPTAEFIGELTKTRHVGVLATAGTIRSESYPLEIQKLYPDIHVTGTACPLWVPLVENGEADSQGSDYFVKKYINELLSQDRDIDVIILGCTHYPLLMKKIRQYTPSQRLSFTTSRDGYDVLKRRDMRLLYHGIGREISRIGIRISERADQCKKYHAGIVKTPRRFREINSTEDVC